MALSNNRRVTPLTFAESPYSPSPVFEDYFYAVHPETGLDVVYVPGEAKPQFVLEQEAAAAAAPPSEPPVKRGNKAVKASE
ncbi:hypothetical protein [Arthrobacter sp. FW306-04-A]|uniref:hypothetical protein n=1 Tax=Arthrobacter sp. FW306-04-A TaxID=2879619 RepID=UPI0037C160DF|nr:hypothetical protein LFT43_12345 [Arthrobacter sp. FW306-04-A]